MMYVFALYACTWSSGSVLALQLAWPCIQLTASVPGTRPPSAGAPRSAGLPGAPDPPPPPPDPPAPPLPPTAPKSAPPPVAGLPPVGPTADKQPAHPIATSHAH